MIGDRLVRHREAHLGIPLRELGPQLERARRQRAEASPLERRPQLHRLFGEPLGLEVAFAADGASELVLDLVPAVVELPHDHENRLKEIERLEARHRDGLLPVAGETLVGLAADDGADVPRADEAVDANAAVERFRAAEDGFDRARREHVVHEDGEVLEVLGLRRLHRESGRRRRGLEADGKEDDLRVGVFSREGERVVRAEHHAHVGAAGPGLHQADAVFPRHAHHVAVGAEHHAGAGGERDDLVDAADGQHAHRAAGAVNHLDVLREQLDQAVAAERVRVATAELHHLVLAVGLHLGGDLRGDLSCEGPVTELIDELHG